MIDPTAKLSVSRQVIVLGISRGSVYYKPRPVSDAEPPLSMTSRLRSADHFRAVCQEHNRPKVEAFKAWAEEQLEHISGKSELAKAFRYDCF